MLNDHYIATLLDLPDVFISSVDNLDDAITAFLTQPVRPHGQKSPPS